jgi:hypothetical protein
MRPRPLATRSGTEPSFGMTRPLRFTLLSLRDLAVSFGPFILLAIGLLALAYWWLDPMPPRSVRLATGPAQSAYAEFGEHYKRALKANHIDVVLVASEGSADNLRLLDAGEVDVGFVQGGSRRGPRTGEEEAPELVSLGDLFLEPVWLFYRSDAARRIDRDSTLANLAQFRTLRVNIGTEGSGVPYMMQALFRQNGLDVAGMQLSRMDQTAATVAFLGGEIDALVFASAPESLMVQMLLKAPGVKLFSFLQNEAYARRLPFLSPVRLPRGVVDLAADIPPRDVRLVASTTTLLAREGVHPAVLQLLSQASLTLHGKAGWFSRPREYPVATNAEFGVAKEAERTIQGGVPLLQRYLPFTLANLLERMWLSLGIILALLLPLSRIVPPLYEFRIRSRVFRWYARLRDIEYRHESGEADQERLRQDLDELDATVGKVVIPLSHADELYALRQHISMVRRRLQI